MPEELIKEKREAALEALLFSYGEPLSFKKAAELLTMKEEELPGVIEGLKATLSVSGRGLTLLIQDTMIQLVTKPDFGQVLERLVKDEFRENLTPAGVEAISIIAYAGPISRAILDYIRGVNSSFILRALLLRGLVDRASDPARANAYVYSISFNFLRHLGITGVAELPDYEKTKQLLQTLQSS